MAKPTRGLLDTHSPLEPESYGSIIHQLDIHQRAKFAAFEFKPSFAESGKEAFVQWNRDFGSRRVNEAGASSLLRVSVECKLRHDQHRAADFREAEIHLALGVAKKSKSRGLVRHPVDFLGGIGVREAYKKEKSLPNATRRALSDADFSPRDALKQDSQYYSTVTDLARLRGWSTFVPRLTAM